MAFDILAFPGASAGDRAVSRQNRRLVAVWLFAVGGMIVVMIALGGATRLSGSGLSIMEWAPLLGTLPPLSDAEWQRLFNLYQQIPQYHLVNHGFGLEGFKQIFWLEWTHRLWGRLIGLAFLVPLIWLVATSRIERRLIGPLVALFALGGLQGAVGWFMVASGFFQDATAVSPFRLTVHLALALLLYSALVWIGLTVLRPVSTTPRLRGLSMPLAILALASVALTIIAGGLVAGTHAGLDYNTFPLMDGHIVPEGYARLTPLIRNLSENIAAIQFDHRLLASLTVASVGGAMLAAQRSGHWAMLRKPAMALGIAVAVQYLIGVETLLFVVPLPLAVLHQIGATALLTGVLVFLHFVSRPPPRHLVQA